jgi:Protein of unknown function (DUF3040)
VLSDHERKALSEVERRLMADDPEFARHFEAGQARLQRHPRRRAAVLAVGGAVLLAVLMLLAGSVTGALATLVATVLISAMWCSSTGTESRTNPIPFTDENNDRP